MARTGRKNRKGFEPVSAQNSHAPRMGDLTVADYANGMPNIRLGEMFKSFFRQMPWVLPLLAIGAFVAWKATEDFKRTYTGNSRVLVQFSDDYAYSSITQNSQNSGLSQTIDTVTLTEAALMKHGGIIDVVIDKIGRNRIAPDAWEKVESAPNEQAEKIAWMEFWNEVGDSYLVMPRAKSQIIDVAFKHEDPRIAVDATNAFVKAYLIDRKRVFEYGADEKITERRQATEEQLNANERSIAAFLKKHNISDFTSEQTGLQERTEDLKASLNGTRASISETEAALVEVEDQLRGTPKQIDLYRDDIQAQRVAQAELELSQLLAKYLPTSDPVRQKQAELNELRALQSAHGGRASGGRRVGPNPLYQELLERRHLLASTADSLREREFTVQRQLNSADAKIRRMTSISPEFQNLLRERETLNERLNVYNTQEQEALVDSDLAAAAADNVTVVSEATYPNKGRNMRMLMFALATLGWGVILFFIAMIRVFLDPRLYSAPVPANRQTVADVYADEDLDMDEQPVYDPIPDPVPEQAPPPAYVPDIVQPATQPNYAESYPVQQQVQPEHFQPDQFQQEQFQMPVGYDQFGRQVSTPFQPPAHQGQSDLSASNAAFDMGYNPYASGEAQAGAFDDASSNAIQYDQFGQPIVPQPY